MIYNASNIKIIAATVGESRILLIIVKGIQNIPKAIAQYLVMMKGKPLIVIMQRKALCDRGIVHNTNKGSISGFVIRFLTYNDH